MKRTATTLVMLAGFSGGCVSTDGPNAKKTDATDGFGKITRPMIAPGVQGPTGEPVTLTTARSTMPTTQQGAYPAGTATVSGGGVVRAHVPGVMGADTNVVAANYTSPGSVPSNAGIIPTPGMGPPGAVAAVGALNPALRAAITNQRTSIRFTGPAGMKVTWQLPGGAFNDEATGLTAPKEYNFLQGQVYRLRLSQVLPNFPGRWFYPTLEVTPGTPKSLTFLAHSSVPITFTNEDFQQAADGNMVVKVIYLPDPAFQDFVTVGAAEEIVSTRLEPGADPVAEAQRRGTILAIIRLGNIDLENHTSPGMTAPPGMGPPPGMLTPPKPAPGANAVPQMLPPIATTRPMGSAPAPSPQGPAAPLPPGPLPPTVQGLR